MSDVAIPVLDPKDMTEFQCLVTGLRIFESYVCPENRIEVGGNHVGAAAGRSGMIYEIVVTGVHRDALGGDDRARLEAMNWRWSAVAETWHRYL